MKQFLYTHRHTYCLFPLSWLLYWSLTASAYYATVMMAVLVILHTAIMLWGFSGYKRYARASNKRAMVAEYYKDQKPYTAEELSQPVQRWEINRPVTRCCFNHVFGDRNSRCLERATHESLYEGLPVGMVWCIRHIPPARKNGFTVREIQS